jgi:hypothetical protein
MDRVTVSADIAEVWFRMIPVGSLVPTSFSYTTRATQTYREVQGNYNPYKRDIEAKQRPGQNLPAVSQYTMVMPQRNEHPNAVRLMHIAPLNDWSKG